MLDFELVHFNFFLAVAAALILSILHQCALMYVRHWRYYDVLSYNSISSSVRFGSNIISLNSNFLYFYLFSPHDVSLTACV